MTKCQKKYSSVKNALKHKSIKFLYHKNHQDFQKMPLEKIPRILSSLPNRFCLKTVRLKLQKLQKAIFGHTRLKLEVLFSFLIHL